MYSHCWHGIIGQCREGPAWGIGAGGAAHAYSECSGRVLAPPTLLLVSLLTQVPPFCLFARESAITKPVNATASLEQKAVPAIVPPAHVRLFHTYVHRLSSSSLCPVQCRNIGFHSLL